MAEVDARIPLGVRPSPFDPNTALQNAGNIMAFRQQTEQYRAGNALREVFANPENLDENGQPTMAAIQKVMAISPQAGMELRNNMLKAEQAKLQMKVTSSALFAQKMQARNQVEDGALVAYNEAIDKGVPPGQASVMAQKIYTKGLEDLRTGGLFSEDDLNKAPPNFDPNRAKAFAQTFQQWEKSKADRVKEDALEKDRAEGRAIARGHLGVSQGNLAVAQAREKREAGGVPGLTDAPPAAAPRVGGNALAAPAAPAPAAPPGGPTPIVQPPTPTGPAAVVAPPPIVAPGIAAVPPPGNALAGVAAAPPVQTPPAAPEALPGPALRPDGQPKIVLPWQKSRPAAVEAPTVAPTPQPPVAPPVPAEPALSPPAAAAPPPTKPASPPPGPTVRPYDPASNLDLAAKYYATTGHFPKGASAAQELIILRRAEELRGAAGAPVGKLGTPTELEVDTGDGGKKRMFGQQDPNTSAWFTADEKREPIKGVIRTLTAAERQADPNAAMSAEELKFNARQYLAGDHSVMQNLGRGAQGSGNLVSLRRAIMEEAKSQGMTPEMAAIKGAEFMGLKAGERTLGTRTANVEMAVVEAQKLATLALEASDRVSRTQFTPLNRALQMVDKGTGGTGIAEFVAANTSFINVYARAIAPSGVPTVSDKEHARDMINTAQTKEQYRAVIGQLQKEMAAAREAPGEVRQEFREGYGGTRNPPGGTSPAPTIDRPGTDAIALPKTEAEYKALPKGAKYRMEGDAPDEYRVKP